MTYRFLPHTADIRVAIEAPSLELLFAEATEVMRQLLAGDSPVESHLRHPVRISTGDTAELLLGYLRELLYRFDTDRFVPARVAFDMATPTQMAGEVSGEKFDPARHQVQPEVKAVTRHGLVVAHKDTGWHAEVLFDL
ncbi:MAG: hypothetical protein GTN78_20670 [Gemmatimonadales bacterium]|nr:hypothetical protein [Gemmatimonadales bacterium]NIN10097.1 hypothetical protein [Gemmatimonadales bacterium]NIR02581.1 hypothetical protein [Gemmatimonadales bacterium]NIS66275.1 hypothetical protein [Gemmatimonadales bacterium]